jgi:hypothetical protein
MWHSCEGPGRYCHQITQRRGQPSVTWHFSCKNWMRFGGFAFIIVLKHTFWKIKISYNTRWRGGGLQGKVTKWQKGEGVIKMSKKVMYYLNGPLQVQRKRNGFYLSMTCTSIKSWWRQEDLKHGCITCTKGRLKSFLLVALKKKKKH